MHLFSPELLAASSGIVGASGPAAVGFGLAGQMLRPGSVAVAFFGEGALNQGMLMEAMNLAVTWKLPVLFVCKDNQWAITTQSGEVSGSQPMGRAQGLGLPATEVDGREVLKVWDCAREALQHARSGKGPVFIHARCSHLEGHFLGDALLAMQRQPRVSVSRMRPILRATFKRGGAPTAHRLRTWRIILRYMMEAQKQTSRRNDPLRRARQKLIHDPGRLRALEHETKLEIDQVVSQAISINGKPALS
jgi:pyruvate dehydrogenase E1 component alpha subunit